MVSRNDNLGAAVAAALAPLPWINPLDPEYGAVGDGVANDAAELQAAINAAEAAGGGIVVIPGNKTFKTDGTTLVIDSPNVHIIGTGSITNATTTIIRIEETRDVTVRGIRLVGGGIWNTTNRAFTAPPSLTYPGVQRGIYVVHSSDVIVEGCDVSLCSLQGIMVTGQFAGNSTVYSSTLCHDVTVTKNRVSYCNQGITVFSGATKIIVTDNQVTYSRTWGIGVDDMSTDDTQSQVCDSIVISNNVVTFSGLTGATQQSAILVEGTTNSTVTGNTVTDSGLGTYDGSNTATTSHCTGITLSSSQGPTITKNVLVANNVIARNSRQGMVLQAAQYCKIVENSIFDSGYLIGAVSGEESVQFTTAAIGDVVAPASTQGASYNEFSRNTIRKVSANSDTDYGVYIRDHDAADQVACIGNVLRDNIIGATTAPIFDDGSGNVISGTRTAGGADAGVESAYYDDFLGDTLRAEWTTVVGSDPQCVAAAIVADQIDGVAALTTGDDAAASMAVNGSQLTAGLNYLISPASTPRTLDVMFRLKLDAITNVAVFIGFTDNAALEMPFTLGGGDALTSNATNAVGVLFDTAADTDNWWLVGVKADADATKQNSGVAPAPATYETWRISVGASGIATFWRNGTLVGSPMINAINPALVTPVVAAFSRGAASRTVSVDYVRIGGLKWTA